MQPLIVANEVHRCVADFLATAFPSTTPGFQGLIDRFLAHPANLFRGPYLSVALPFRAGHEAGTRFSWLPEGFTPISAYTVTRWLFSRSASKSVAAAAAFA
ncbi:MAG: hypothetical protein Q8M11_22150 [Sulfuritalea sp.]|nr:hypothetical protein [Sulfuritalea sp.]